MATVKKHATTTEMYQSNVAEETGNKMVLRQGACTINKVQGNLVRIKGRNDQFKVTGEARTVLLALPKGSSFELELVGGEVDGLEKTDGSNVRAARNLIQQCRENGVPVTEDKEKEMLAKAAVKDAELAKEADKKSEDEKKVKLAEKLAKLQLELDAKS